MKLKDILKTDTDNKGWLKVFKKLGADAEMLKYVNENISKSGGGEGVKEYYYNINIQNLLNLINFCDNSLVIYTNYDKELSPGNRVNEILINSNSIEHLVNLSLTSYNIRIVDTNIYINDQINIVDFVKENIEMQEITKEEYESLITQ